MFAEKNAEKIRERAYQLFLERKDEGPGDAVSDWLKAERQVQSEEANLRHRGSARLGLHHQHHHTLTDNSGCDVENPT